MPPTGGETGDRNLKVALQLGAWEERDATGAAFDSSTGFVLPNGAVCSPDATWVGRERLAKLTAEQKRKFLPLCPDFVVEPPLPNPRGALAATRLDGRIHAIGGHNRRDVDTHEVYDPATDAWSELAPPTHGSRAQGRRDRWWQNLRARRPLRNLREQHRHP